jgi:hypothetical protein
VSNLPSAPRRYWIDALHRVADPVLSTLASGKLKSSLPVANGEDPSQKIHAPLEAFARTLAGIAPWLEAPHVDAAEAAGQERVAGLVRAGIQQATDPQSPDFMNFTEGGQPLVDASFLALGLLRARHAVWDRLDAKVRGQVVACLRETRRITPGFNNWLLFSAMIEAFFCAVGEEWDRMRVDYAIRQHDQWYKGDGDYGDGPFHHWDYYNSFVIQPYLLELLAICAPAMPDLRRFEGPMIERARRYAAVQERMIAPDGSFPPIGRSLTYRFGVFHHLAFMALRDLLPEDVAPAQVRCGLGAVLGRLLAAPGLFDANGWLTAGLAGLQPSLAEGYISTGSLYLFSCGFLPLGLAPDHPFWSAPDADWTSKKVWSGQDIPVDHAMDDRPTRSLTSA